MAQSSFNIGPVFQYLSERFQMGRFVPLTFILYLGCLLSFNFAQVSPQNFIIILLMLLSFRLMDDLFDLQSDRDNFPDRVLSRMKDTNVFVFFLFVLYSLLAAIFILNKNLLSLFILLSTIIFLGFWYIKLRHLFNTSLLHTFVILLKYPLILYIIVPELTRIEIPALIYLTFLVFEIQDDYELKSNITAKGIQTACIFGYMVLLLFVLVFPSNSIGSWIVLIISLGLQTGLWVIKDNRTAYIPFINTFLLFAFLSARYLIK